ncbi:unnamed protein product [Miscanthus lutarioriparius]|uniref:DYW domain-containing protein n=1 Tax=Miscanthus lutarioriparius TaxID=422564 RepID=A0A811NNL4_9POAL|nr:unnamed protein product [Miscanthus lutarioriparius]
MAGAVAASMQFGTPPPSPAARRAPTFHADPAADARQLLGALLPPRPALHHVLQAHARLAVLGLATARALPQLLAALPRLPLAAAAAASSHSYPLSLFRCASCASAFASNHLLRVLPHPLPLRLFPRLPRRNPHSFTFLLASLSNHLDADPAAAGSISSRFMGTHVHALAVKAGAAGDLYVRNALIHFYGVCGDVAAMRKVFDELPLVRDVVTWNAVLAGYVRAGMVGVAREVFDGMPVRDEVSWSTVVGGYVKEGELEVALGVFKNMVVQGVKANEAAIVTALSAAAQLGLLEQGKFVHEVVKRAGMAMSVNLGAALVDMYSKCGSVAAAKEVFDAMPRRDVFAWNSMICGLATHGLGHDAVQLFEKFVSEGFCPTSITFVGVLNACSRTGLVDEGRWYFKLMAEKYVLWGTVLSACKRHGLVDLGITVGNKLIELDPAHDGHYVLLASIYAKAKKWDEVRKVRKLMSNRGTSKSAGWSLMEAHGIVHKFLVGDMDHKDSVHIYNMLCMIDRRLAEAGYVPDVSSVLHDIGDEEKVHAIKVHSERLAIAYGFIVVEAGSPIRIVKNLSVCGDCHEFSKMVTKVFGREIVVRDGSRCHIRPLLTEFTATAYKRYFNLSKSIEVITAGIVLQSVLHFSCPRIVFLAPPFLARLSWNPLPIRARRVDWGFADQMRRAGPCSAAGLGGLSGLDVDDMEVPPRNPSPASERSLVASNLEQKTGKTFKADVHSALKSCSGIGSLVIAKCSHIFDRNEDTFDGKCSLQDVLKPGLWLSPEIFRRFWCVSELKPKDFLDILIGFGPSAAEVRKARFLWNLYRWASQQSKEFQHLPRSNEAMAWLFFQRLEALGFAPDATTFEIFIVHSCREVKLKSALVYLSECFSRHVKPGVYAYNAILGGVFREGLYRHAKYVFEYMVEREVIPNLSTYKILLAGYCRYRQFDDTEQVLRDMKTNGVNDLPSGNCVFSKALSFLGLDHLGVKTKRDNAAGFPKAEFFDSVGNGLYLDTDSKMFESSLAQVLDSALHPDINSELVRASQQGNVASALLVKDEAYQWGYDISPASCSELFEALFVSPGYVIDAIDLMEEMPDMFNKLDAQKDLVAQTLSRKGMSAHARLVLEKMIREGLSTSHNTYI